VEADEKAYRKSHFHPKIWLKMTLDVWGRALWESRFRIGLSSLHSLFFISISASITSLFSLVEFLLFRTRVNRTIIDEHPVFVIGHWRSGTTLLHEFFSMDEQFAYANTFQCFNPHTFLLTEQIAGRIFDVFVPRERPMDAMPMGSKRPQEDEFALCLMGAPSPYLGIMFPDLLQDYGRYLRVSDLDEGLQERWKHAVVLFFKRLTFKYKKRLVLKSPTHSFRIKLLSRMFPGARFVHIRRDPYRVFSSTRHLWMTLLNQQGLHNVNPDIVDRYILETYPRMMEAVRQDRREVPEGQFCEIAFEDLVSKPVDTMEQVYRTLGLEGFEEVKHKILKYQEQHKDYKPNKFVLRDDDVTLLNDSWGKQIRDLGYELRVGTVNTPDRLPS
jgi:hypothetical protein